MTQALIQTEIRTLIDCPEWCTWHYTDQPEQHHRTEWSLCPPWCEAHRPHVGGITHQVKLGEGESVMLNPEGDGHYDLDGLPRYDSDGRSLFNAVEIVQESWGGPLVWVGGEAYEPDQLAGLVARLTEVIPLLTEAQRRLGIG